MAPSATERAVERDSRHGELLRVSRVASYMNGGPDAVFGWYHSAEGAPPMDCVAVLCSPLGHEYINSYSSVRSLADALARRGIPAVRFDYHGTGNSPDLGTDQDRLRCWQGNIGVMIRRARELSGRTRVCLIGIRFGATLAALVAQETHADLLVLWNPCISGRRYLRELQAIAAAAETANSDPGGALEVAGFTLSSDTCNDIRGIDLLKGVPDAGRTLVVDRDDLTPERSLCARYGDAGIAIDYVGAPGYAEMMVDLPFVVVPHAALGTIAEWVMSHSAACEGHPIEVVPSRDANMVSSVVSGRLTPPVQERLCRYGSDEHLFGVLSCSPGASPETCVVLFNSGSVHNVGPHRVYVSVARDLAARGVACFRFDLEGIGDSVRRTPGRENHPYPETATEDALATLRYLQERFGFKRFIASGICSGAHTAFHAALQADRSLIAEIVLINPLTFRWTEDLSLATSVHFADMAHYRHSAKDSSNWMRLLRGKVGIGKLSRVALAYMIASGKAHVEALRDTLFPNLASELSRDLQRLFASKCQITLILSEREPGRDILLAGAKRTASRALKTGQIRVHTVAHADHTFSQSAPRRALIAQLYSLLSERTASSR